MGAYVNPPDMTGEEWLEKHGVLVECDLSDGKRPAFSEVAGDGVLPVILVDNGPFVAAAIAFSEPEYTEFTAPDNPRPRKMYVVEVEKLLQVSNLKKYLVD